MTAQWTTPRTWTDGEAITETIANTHIRDNFEYLKLRAATSWSDLDGTVFSTSSTSFVDITGATISPTVTAGARLLIVYSGTANASASSSGMIDLMIDGVSVGHATDGTLYMAPAVASNVPFQNQYLTAPLSGGTHTIKLRLKDETVLCPSIVQLSLTAWEI
jgi:hypothetical protein